MTTYLLKLGELTLKGENRRFFERVLKQNIFSLLKETNAKVESKRGRFFVHCIEDEEEKIEDALNHLIGITGFAKTRFCEKTITAILFSCIEEMKVLLEKRNIKTFKVEARREDKSFPLDSYNICCSAGSTILENFPTLKVDVHNPDGVIEVEIREKAYIYSTQKKGIRGLPVGTAGRGMLLLSGGIDSPVAGFLMATRGMSVDAVYFHAYPYTSFEAQQKVVTLANIISRYTLGLRLYVISFTEIQKVIKEKAPETWLTVILRMAMMECAEILAFYREAKCLITGESLSQVASQTIENISCTESRIKLPVFRPLIGMNKEDIIKTAESIGTYKTSILPYQDCCVLFSPSHPILHGKVKDSIKLYENLELSDLIKKAIEENETIKCPDYTKGF